MKKKRRYRIDKKRFSISISIFVLFIVLIISLIYGCAKGDNKETLVEETEVVISEDISIFALGDNLLHMPVINSGKKSDGTYNYAHLFKNFQPEIKEADFAVIGQETVFGGEKFGYSGYPLFNSPSDMGVSLVEEGFDIVLHASNHVLDKWAEGIENTLEFWKGYPEVEVLGINESEEAKNEVCIKEVKGAKLAFLNYTYGTNGLTLPAGKEYLVNYIDEEKIEKDVTIAETNADFTVAFMHWGTEYSIKPDDFQKDLAEKMCQWGVDLIIGSHPHVIEPMEWVKSENGNKMLCYYSLGNYVSRQLEARNLLGAIADVTLHYDGEKVMISDYEYIPIVTHYDTNYANFSVQRLREYSNDYAKGHGITSHDGAVSVERWTKMVEETFEGYDMTKVDLVSEQPEETEEATEDPKETKNDKKSDINEDEGKEKKSDEEKNEKVEKKTKEEKTSKKDKKSE